ncbi:hypothetical protein [Dethiothermospora halolimnae]|uniref:hypothetical protein n=1 Tax=Dethiothermospora halolimnae TaxID=3114390 RepID=UPI003CCB826B
MNSFKAYLKKEIIEGIRSYKYLIIGVSIVLFAILDPLMLKMLPKILENQVSMNIVASIEMTQKMAVQNYMKDLFQIVNIVLALSLMGILADEVKGQTLAFPYSKGVSKTGMVLAKTINYSLVIPIFMFIGFSINYYYSKILFSKDVIDYLQVMKGALLFSSYYIFNISLIVLLSSLVKKGLIAGFLTLAIIFTMPLFYKINSISEFLPYNLVTHANMLDQSGGIPWISFGVTFVYIVVFNILTIYRMKRVEAL